MSENNVPMDATVSLDVTQAVSVPAAEKTQMGAGVTCPVCCAANSAAEVYCTDCGFLLASKPVETGESPVEPRARLVSEDGLRELVLKPGVNIVGRKDSDILIAEPTISRNHARIELTDSGATVTDLGSTNGTAVGTRILAAEQPVSLADSDEIRFGSVKFIFHAAPAEPDEGLFATCDSVADETITEPEATEDSDKKLYGVLKAKEGTEEYQITGPATIGRRDDNDIVISDPFCSSKHARIDIGDGVVSITDTGSSNGTAVNGILLEVNQPRELAFGDEITVGQTCLVFEEAAGSND